MDSLEWYHKLSFSSVFPAELWELIMDKLSHPDDIEKLLNSIPNLSQNFNKAKIHILFPKVLPLLLKNSMFHGQEILKCRLVSKFWCEQIDHFLETSEPMSQPYSNISSIVPNITEVDLENGIANRPAVSLQTVADIRLLQTFLSKHPGNPFVSREINFLMNAQEVIDENAEEYDNDYQATAIQFIRSAHSFLRKFGHLIRFVTLDFGSLYAGDDPILTINTYTQVVQCIVYLCNAKSIKINLKLQEESPYLAWFDVTVADELQGSKLKCLKSFELMSTTEIPYSSCMVLLKFIVHQGHLQSIGLPLSLWHFEYKPLLKNVRNLCIDAESSSGYRKLTKLFTNMGSNNLTKVTLIPRQTKKNFLNMVNIFKQLQNSNVKFLDICNYKPYMNISMPRLTENSALRICSIEFVSLYDSPEICYDFLYLLPRIQFLRIHANCLLEFGDCIDSVFPISLTEVIHQYIYARRIKDKVSIWNKLPSLNNFKIILSDVRIKQFWRETKNKYIENKL